MYTRGEKRFTMFRRFYTDRESIRQTDSKQTNRLS